MCSTRFAVSLMMLTYVPDAEPLASRGRDAEAVGVGVDVVEQGESGLLEQCARMPGRQRLPHHVEQAQHLAVDDNGVEALLAAEVLVHDRLAHLRPSGDLLDRGAFEAALANTARAVSMSCSRRSAAVMR
jgi:hypothetical protein